MGSGYTSRERTDKISLFYYKYGAKATEEHFGIKLSTIERYLRRTHEAKKSSPKILLFDLEMSPLECYTWGIYQQFITPEAVIKQSSILSWSAKWLCDNKIMSSRVTVSEAKNRKDETIIRELWKLLDEAHVIIAHNCKGFDEKQANTRFILNNLNPPSPYKLIDTLQHSRSRFMFASNKLDYLTKIFDMNKKKSSGFNLWKRCVTGDEQALDEMQAYNKQDVRALEDLYLKIRPWIKFHPNLSLYYDDMQNRCPNCGNQNIKIKGCYYTVTGRYKAIKCNDCGAYGRKRYQDLSFEQKKELLRPIS